MTPQEMLADSQCIAHPVAFEADCEYCVNEIDAYNRMLAKLQQRNGAAEQRIAYLGQTVQLVDVVMLRLNTFIDLLLQNPKMKARFEITYAVNCEEALRLTEERVNRERLTAGINLRPS